MSSIEVLIVALWMAALASVVIGALGVMREWARVERRPFDLPRGGRHRAARRSRLAALAKSCLDSVRELAAAYAPKTSFTIQSGETR